MSNRDYIAARRMAPARLSGLAPGGADFVALVCRARGTDPVRLPITVFARAGEDARLLAVQKAARIFGANFLRLE